ncbi:MAG: hypothetical protein HY782_19695, partial [Chloroflexi bacterium]|nr:hypothetical protein [Chloroflexota bacterium]
MKRTMLIGAAFVIVLTVALMATDVMAQGPSGTASSRSPRVPVGTGFTYQGLLKSGGNAVNQPCDFQFGLWEQASGGIQVSGTSTQTVSSVPVSNGLFNATVDFGANAFNGEARYLGIAVACPVGGSYTPFASRQALTPAPYAVYATTATNLTGALAGDVTGTQGSTTVTKLQGRTIASTVPAHGQVLKYDGSQWAPGTDNAANYQNVVVVAKSGGNYTTVGAALASITTNSATNRFLIWVAPGTYTEMITMKEYVDIEGAGENATKITYTGSAVTTTGTVKGVSNAELRFLAVENTGGNTYAIAINNTSASPRLTHLTASASGGTYNRGVYNLSSSLKMTNVTATGSGGTYNRGVYNYASSSPTMTNVTATASGGTGTNQRVYNFSSSPTMTNVTATASGPNSYGVYNDYSSPTIQNSVIRASGGSNNYGIYNDAIGGSHTLRINNS